MKTALFVFGTRPEAIKMAPLIIKMKSSQMFKVLVCVTGQHREMLDQVLDLFDIKPNFDLNVMEPDQTLCGLSSKILDGIDRILQVEQPHVVLVHGDTTTSFISALASYYAGIPVAHVEAGLRSGNIKSPWPEEGNRRLTGQISRFHFAPTELNKNNLISEGIDPTSVFVTGNTVIDALLNTLKITRSVPFAEKLKYDEDISQIKSFDKLVLITGHRRENFGKNLEQICLSIKSLANKYEDVLFYYPVHLNPNVTKPVNRILANLPNVWLTKPLSYSKFVYVMDNSYLILSDSGGIQEEAPTLGKPVLVMRENTERPEGISAGSSILVGYRKEKIIETVSQYIDNQTDYAQVSKVKNPYGCGGSAAKISNILLKTFQDH